jgi:hypothetical protein
MAAIPSITDATLTLRGRVNSRVAKVFVDGAEITLAADKTFIYSLTAPASKLINFTTVDNDGHSETRAVQVTRTSQAAPPPPIPFASA